MFPQSQTPHPIRRNPERPRHRTTPGFRIFGNLQRQDDIDGVKHLRISLVQT
jgi:hypothetical protein